MSDKEIPFDQWTEVPNERLTKIGKTGWIYRPSKYPGPIAFDATIKNHFGELENECDNPI